MDMFYSSGDGFHAKFTREKCENKHIPFEVMKQDLLKWRINTYVGDGICFSELVDCDIEDGHDEDEGPVCKVYKKPRRAPDWTRKLDSSRSQRGKEVNQVEPEFQSPREVQDVEEVGHLKTSSWPMHQSR